MSILLEDMQSAMHHKELGTHFTNGVWAQKWNLVKIYFTLLLILSIQSGHNFAHVMTAELSCHVQSCDLIGPVFFTSNKDIFIWRELWIHNLLVKCYPGHQQVLCQPTFPQYCRLNTVNVLKKNIHPLYNVSLISFFQYTIHSLFWTFFKTLNSKKLVREQASKNPKWMVWLRRIRTK